jgi:hypothetical protein
VAEEVVVADIAVVVGTEAADIVMAAEDIVVVTMAAMAVVMGVGEQEQLLL